MTKIARYTPPPQELVQALHDGLARAGQTLSDNDLRNFLFAAHDDAGAMIGGCRGEIAFRSARVSELWVSEAARGQGLGGTLLQAAEAHARDHDCIRIHIETRNEGARRLYERQGYRIFGELTHYDGEQSFYYMEKRLPPAAETG
ncbi:GNAT family N-acetyltransferase [Yoonia sp. 208BN28-4]|uniref:GNAT family N-acetyltransferase n=1 Tax=Yoonia sp. 208BN28-4 TaxID=3126505 RepID=UPI0030A830B2